MYEFGACTVSIASRLHHGLEDKIRAMAAEGHKWVDLYELDFLDYLSKQPGYDAEDPWAPTPAHLDAARRIGTLTEELGMKMLCLQPLIDVEGLLEPKDRAWAEKRVKSCFPFMRALRTQILYMTSQRRKDAGVTGDHALIANDLALFGDWAADFATRDNGPKIIIGFEPLSWGSKVNTWLAAWDCVRLANHPNVELVLDTFNMLAVEYANPYNPQGHGRIHETEEESMATVRQSLKKLADEVDGNKICMLQVADAELVDPKTFLPPTDPTVAPLQPWSRGRRLYPSEQDRGGYMPVADCVAAILSTGYKGPLTVEVFNHSLNSEDPDTAQVHSKRAIVGLQKLMKEVEDLISLYS